jgi:hypothetical protein
MINDHILCRNGKCSAVEEMKVKVPPKAYCGSLPLSIPAVGRQVP